MKLPLIFRNKRWYFGLKIDINISYNHYGQRRKGRLTKRVFLANQICVYPLMSIQLRGEEITRSPPRSGNWMIDGVSREVHHDRCLTSHATCPNQMWGVKSVVMHVAHHSKDSTFMSLCCFQLQSKENASLSLI